MNKLKAAFHDSCSSAQLKAVHPLGCPGPRGALFCSAAFNHLLKSQLHMKIAHCVCAHHINRTNMRLQKQLSHIHNATVPLVSTANCAMKAIRMSCVYCNACVRSNEYISYVWSKKIQAPFNPQAEPQSLHLGLIIEKKAVKM